MQVKYSALDSKIKQEIKSIMKGNGLKVSDAKIFNDGDKYVLQIEKIDTFINVN